jgi:hypothetical protein
VKNCHLQAFSGCTSLVKLKTQPKLESIGRFAFDQCTSIRTADLSASLKLAILAEGTFSECSTIRSIALPDSVTVLGPSVFQGCRALARVDMPEALQKIGSSAFTDCTSIGELVLPSNLQEFGSQALQGVAPNLRLLVVPEGTSSLVCQQIRDDIFSHRGRKSQFQMVCVPDTILPALGGHFGGMRAMVEVPRGRRIDRNAGVLELRYWSVRYHKVCVKAQRECVATVLLARSRGMAVGGSAMITAGSAQLPIIPLEVWISVVLTFLRREEFGSSGSIVSD